MALRSLLGRIKNYPIELNKHRTTKIYFISYPKTGSTWLRFMLGKYMQLFCNLSYQPLFESYDWLGRCEHYCVGHPMQFTHAPLIWEHQTTMDLQFDNVIRPYLNKEVVLITRNPLDTLVSMWFDMRYRASIYTGELPELLEDPVCGMEKFFRFHRLWAEFCNRVKGFYLVRYEELKTSCSDRIKELLEFIDIPINEPFLQAAVDHGSFDNMKKMERSGEELRYPSSGLKVFGTGDRKNPDSYHIRRGKVGGYKDYLDPDMVALYEAKVAQEMPTWDKY